jgi:HEAT repeat protein
VIAITCPGSSISNPMNDPRPEAAVPIGDAALLRLRSLGVQRDSAAVAELIAALGDPAASQIAASLLGQCDLPEAVSALLDRLRHDADWKVRAICAGALDASARPEVLPDLLAALQDEVAEVVEETCRSLSASEDAQVIEPLRSLLSHPDLSVRLAAVEALLGLGIADTAVAELLTELADDEVSALPGSSVSHASREVSALPGSSVSHASRLERLRHEFSELSGAPNQPGDLASALQRARQELSDPETEIRMSGVNRLRKIPDETGIALLLQAFEDTSPRVRGSVALALGTGDLQPLPALIRHLRENASAHVRLMCAVSLGWTSDSRTVEPLLAALRDGLAAGDWKLTMTCAQTLGASGAHQAIPLLLEALDQPRWSARRSAAQALLDLEVADGRLVSALERMSREPDAAEWNVSAAESRRDLDLMRELAAKAGDPEPTALPTIQEMIDQARELVRKAEAALPEHSTQ